MSTVVGPVGVGESAQAAGLIFEPKFLPSGVEGASYLYGPAEGGRIGVGPADPNLDSAESITIADPTSTQGYVIDAGKSNDTVILGAGDDIVYGGQGMDTIDGGAGDDVLYGGDTADKLFGGLGDDILYGGQDDDVLEGGAGNDVLYGGNPDGSETGSLNDTLKGGEGDDLLVGGPGYDYFEGGAGADTFRLVGAPDPAGTHGGKFPDYIEDFNPVEDVLEISKSLLPGSGLSEGALSAADFGAVGSSAKIVYDSTNGLLYYNGGGALVPIVRLGKGGVGLTADDIKIIGG